MTQGHDGAAGGIHDDVVDEYVDDAAETVMEDVHHADTDVLSDELHDAYQPAIDATWTEPVPVPVTGDPRVDDALTLLAGLGQADVHDHAPVLQEVHDRLRAVLVDGAGAI